MTVAPLDRKRWLLPAIIFAVSAAVYVATLGHRIAGPTPDNHFVHLAQSFLHGELGVVGNRPPGTNDWAFYEGRWYVSFPPLPAVVILPVVAIFGLATRDALFWAIIAGFGPAVLYVLLRTLREEGKSERSLRDDLLLTVLYAFGSVFFFAAVQGTVWFAAHALDACLLGLFVLFSLDARKPWAAGLLLGLSFLTRATTLFAGVFFAFELMRVHRREGAAAPPEDALVWTKMLAWLRGVDWIASAKRAVPFLVPLVAIGALTMWFNQARFGNPFEFGHHYLQIRWLPRIEKWGLFNYHYLSKNLAVFLAALPWISATAPYIAVSGHGLALWVTTPPYLQVLFPKRVTPLMVSLYVAAAVVALYNLCYQNSGWVQFGYRFSNDYAMFLFALLALTRRRFGPGFIALVVFAIAINTFGAVTFDRMWDYYKVDPNQDLMFQPD